jgi:hypothetical protein
MSAGSVESGVTQSCAGARRMSADGYACLVTAISGEAGGDAFAKGVERRAAAPPVTGVRVSAVAWVGLLAGFGASIKQDGDASECSLKQF